MYIYIYSQRRNGTLKKRKIEIALLKFFYLKKITLNHIVRTVRKSGFCQYSHANPFDYAYEMLWAKVYIVIDLSIRSINLP